jgi:hypothetical protein
MITQFVYDGPFGLLYYVGPAWALPVIVLLLGLPLAEALKKKDRPHEACDNRTEIIAALAALLEATRTGMVSWKKIKRKLGIDKKQRKH